MAYKAILETLEGLDESTAGNYVEKDGKFYLDIEGLDEHPGVGALKRAKNHEKELRQTAEGKLVEAENKVTELEGTIEGIRKGAIPKGDVEALEASYKKKLDDAKNEGEEKLTGFRKLVDKKLLDSEALAMATEISTVPSLLVPHIRARLQVEEADGELTIRVLDAEGKPSAASLADLRKELLSNNAFAPILIGSKASGSGANGGSGGGGASKTLSQMTEKERTEFQKRDPEGFKVALSEQQKAAASNY